MHLKSLLYLLFPTLSILIVSCDGAQKATKNSGQAATAPIDRQALVTRHNPTITAIDSLDVLTVGNGYFAFTVDATGLQTFPEYYEKGIPLGTQADWAWHSFPNEKGYHLGQVSQVFAACKDSIPYVYYFSEGMRHEASEFLRQSPHRLQLGHIGYRILKKDGTEITLEDLESPTLHLNMWTGEVSSRFSVEGMPVQTRLFSHQDLDQIAVEVSSPLIAENRLKIQLRFPYGSGVNKGAGYDYSQPDKHTTKVTLGDSEALFTRTLDTTQFHVRAYWDEPATLTQAAAHTYELAPDPSLDTFHLSVAFAPEPRVPIEPFAATETNNAQRWAQFWESGGAVDFSGSTDPRADELERRVILSQYLTKIQCTGNMPPQETGLTYNTWYGKFHLEMHWWHGVHFMLWDRPGLFDKSMDWYSSILPKAQKTAEWQGFEGARWPKMVAYDGVEGPSSVGTLLAWQQPHPIYYAELFYRDNPSDDVLNRFKEIVFETADFMADFATYQEATDRYDLCPPLIPAQEIFKPANTLNPPFELAYWHYGLSLAQTWRERLGMPRNEKWQAVLDKLAPLPTKNGLYLPHENCPNAYTDRQYRADHPIVLGALGLLPQTEKVDPATMARTFDEIWRDWQWDRTWGWDYPLMAMTAARVGKPDKAVDALLKDLVKNTYLTNGHNYQTPSLALYLPGNGGLLAAVAMMAAGWDGAEGHTPGFPQDGSWQVRWEGLEKMP